MNTKRNKFWKFSVISALVLSVLSMGTISFFNNPQVALANHLTPLSAAEVSTLRWNAIASEYENLADVSALRWNAVAREFVTRVDASTLRWNAIAKSNGAQTEELEVRSSELKSMDAVDASALRWNSMVKFYEAHNESQSCAGK